jgi:beta-N-acetylhexosaminidase
VLLVALTAVGAALLGACTSGPQEHPPASSAPRSTPPHTSVPQTSAPPTSPSSTSSSTPTDPDVRAAENALAAMSASQKVAQLLLTATSSQAASSTVVALIRRGQIGSMILNGHSYQGVAATARITASLQRAVPAGAPQLFVSTDQEGGLVQDLHGPGFDTIPSALQQGSLEPATLRADAHRWGRQLHAAGINLVLGPVCDTVPSAAFAPHNPPIGQLDREFGFTPGTVASHAVAVVTGLRQAGLVPSIKHFPGLGRVTGNTDFTAGVTDSTTTATDSYLTPFRAAIKAGTPFVMMSTAVYSRLDPTGPAAFSHKIVTSLLRGKLGFTGVVISDDVGGAAQVAAVPVGERAVRFVEAGGDIVLTVDPGQIPTMRAALLAQMRHAAFSRLVDAAVLRVLIAKARAGLL